MGVKGAYSDIGLCPPGARYGCLKAKVAPRSDHAQTTRRPRVEQDRESHLKDRPSEISHRELLSGDIRGGRIWGLPQFRHESRKTPFHPQVIGGVLGILHAQNSADFFLRSTVSYQARHAVP